MTRQSGKSGKRSNSGAAIATARVTFNRVEGTRTVEEKGRGLAERNIVGFNKHSRVVIGRRRPEGSMSRFPTGNLDSRVD